MVLVAAAVAFGQRGGGGGGGTGGGEGMSGMPAYVANRLDTITETLQLSKDQKKFVKTTFDEAQKEAAPLREQIGKSHEAIGAAVQAGKSQEEVDSLVAGHTALEARMAHTELKAFAKVYLQLDKAQQDRCQFLFQMMKGMFREKNWNTVQ
jgi:hypothetical protein